MGFTEFLGSILGSDKLCFDDQLYPLYQRMTLLDKILFRIVHFVDRYFPWYKLPVFLGLAYLELRRSLHQRYNLINVGRAPFGLRFNPAEYPYRSADGKLNDPFNEDTGSEGSFFGRNMKPSPQTDKILDPHPSIVATKLLARRELQDTGKQFNVIAASWIQFMIHDWVDHLEDTQQVVLKAHPSVAAACPLKSFKFYQSKEFATNAYDIKTGYKNIRTPWWDGSVIYGNDERRLKQVRTFQDGMLKLRDDGLLFHTDGVPLSGDVRNGWAGLSTLQALFAAEHNAVCDKLKQHHPIFNDEELYRHARLVTSAVIAKIHTIDWTIELLKTDTMHAGMRANWYGLLGKQFKDKHGHTGSLLLSGIVGMPKPINHGVPYSLTEDFVSVYRMHSLLPDSINVRDIEKLPSQDKTPPVAKIVPMADLVGTRGQSTLDNIGLKAMIVSMGHQACGALTLFNYPVWLRDLIAQDVDAKDRPDHVDMPALDVYRDRERNVPRYNQFRRNMLMIPIATWKDLTDDPAAISALQEVYGDDVENLDLLPGMMAEKKIDGFAISETAFFIFLLMASRRLEADRFFTSDFNEEVYTKEGLAWVNSTESLKDVLERHHKELIDKWENSASAFSVWSEVGEAQNPTPLYFRIPK